MLFPVSALLAGITLLVSGNSLLMSLLGIRLARDDVPTDNIGWILGTYAAGFVIGSLYSHRIIGRVGHIRTFAASAGLASIAALAYPLLASPWAWAGLRLLGGICMASLLLAIESWLSTRATNANRASLFAIYQMCFYLSAAGGQWLLATGDPETFQLFNLAGMLVVAALVPVALTQLPAPPIENRQRFSLHELFQISPLAPVTCATSGMVISAFNTMGPVYAANSGMSLPDIAFFMAASTLAAMLFAWPLGRLSDRMDRRHILWKMSSAAAIACLLTALTGQWRLWPAWWPAACFMGISAALYPVAVALTNDRLPLHDIMPASAGLLLAYGLGSCLGPVLSAQIMMIAGPDGLFWGLGLLLILLSGFAVRHQDTGRDIPINAQETFVTTLPDTAPVIAELAPYPELADSPNGNEKQAE